MKLIAHRGNINGKPSDSKLENHPDYLKEALNQGYDIECDVWYFPDTKTFYLGHDEPLYEVKNSFLDENYLRLWAHAKNIDALYQLSNSKINVFYHDTDDVVLTSKGYLWTYPRIKNKLTKLSVAVMPEIILIPNDNRVPHQFEWRGIKDCYAICTDIIKIIENYLK